MFCILFFKKGGGGWRRREGGRRREVLNHRGAKPAVPVLRWPVPTSERDDSRETKDERRRDEEGRGWEVGGGQK